MKKEKRTVTKAIAFKETVFENLEDMQNDIRQEFLREESISSIVNNLCEYAFEKLKEDDLKEIIN